MTQRDPHQNLEQFLQHWNLGMPVDELRTRYGMGRNQVLTLAGTLRRLGFDAARRTQGPPPQVSAETFARVWNDTDAYPTRADVAEALCLAESTVHTLKAVHQRRGVALIDRRRANRPRSVR